jgi:hypothetical protein
MSLKDRTPRHCRRRGVDAKMELVLTARGVAASHSRSGSGANTNQCGPQLNSVIEEVTLNSCVVGYSEVIVGTDLLEAAFLALSHARSFSLENAYEPAFGRYFPKNAQTCV